MKANTKTYLELRTCIKKMLVQLKRTTTSDQLDGYYDPNATPLHLDKEAYEAAANRILQSMEATLQNKVRR